jgi:cholesterol transport system auxiliary component
MRLAAVTLAAVLAGCAGLLQPAPPNLYRLSAVRAFPVDLPHSGARLLVLRPQVAPGLDTARIALTRPPVALDYFAASAWAASLPRLVETALVESFENSGALEAGDRARIGLHPDFVLETEIPHFEAVYGPLPGPPEVQVSLRVWLLRRHSGKVVAHALFAGRKKAPANDVPPIVFALDEALDGAVKEIVVGTAKNLALPARRH